MTSEYDKQRMAKSKARRQEVAAYRAEGHTLAQTAEHFGVSVARIRQIMARYEREARQAASQ